MRSTDPVEPTGLDDHWLVHQFIRTHGRRPTAEELRTLQERAELVAPVSRPRTRTSGMTGVRREIARFVNRL